jgi:hypothetical protein
LATTLISGPALAQSGRVGGGPILPAPQSDVDQLHESGPDSHSAASPTPRASPTPAASPLTWSQIIEGLVRETLPADYEDADDWGRKVRVFAGLNVRDGLRVSKRTKRVNHGLWQRFRVRLLDPERRFQLVLENIRAEADGWYAFDAVITARARCTAQAVSWTYGVQGWSVTLNSDATVRITLDCAFRVRTVPRANGFLADVLFEPDVRGLQLRLTDLHVRRVGQLKGDLAEELGNGSRRFVEDLLQRQQPKVLKTVRREIAEKTARLRIPLPAFLFSADAAAPAPTPAHTPLEELT